MQHSFFSPSINLVRDAEGELGYIPTANARRVYEQILANYALGIRSFNIIGSYGTGKSAFLVAFEKTLGRQASYFDPPNGQFPGVESYEFINLIGSYASLIDAFCTRLGADTEQQFWLRLEERHGQAQRNHACLVIVLDEFGKHLEYAAHTNPEKELYFVQQLAEFVNDPQKNILLLTVLHQSFFTYSAGLDRGQQEEWEKVKGRLKELTFNEPIEQLLELAASHIDAARNGAPIPEDLDLLVDAINGSGAFPHRAKLTGDFAQQVLPFDLLAASVLTQALQKYGQNERSLFTFLNSDEYFGLRHYAPAQAPYYNVACVYDYLSYNYSALLTSVHNPHYAGWGAIRRAIERVEATVADGADADMIGHADALVKVIGLLNIFAPSGARIHGEFLAQYAPAAMGIAEPKSLLKELESRKIIRYVAFKETYVLFDGTDLDIEHALLESESRIGDTEDIITPLQRHFDFPFVLAKAVSYQFGTPRFFEFRLTDRPLRELPEGVTDGIVNLVFGGEIDLDQLAQHSEDGNEHILVGWYRNAAVIRGILYEIRKIDYVIDHNWDDKVAVQELQALKQHQERVLNQAVMNSLYTGDGSVLWVWNGEVQTPRSATQFNSLLSQIGRFVYAQAPVYRSELVNRHSLSSAVATARRQFNEALVAHWDSEDLGFPRNSFPAQKTIYLTLLKQTGIHRQVDGAFTLDAPLDESFLPLWQRCEHFIEQTRLARKPISRQAKDPEKTTLSIA